LRYGAVFGAGAIVTKSVEPYTVVVGASAKKSNCVFLTIWLRNLNGQNSGIGNIRRLKKDFRNMDKFVRKYL